MKKLSVKFDIYILLDVDLFLYTNNRAKFGSPRHKHTASVHFPAYSRS